MGINFNIKNEQIRIASSYWFNEFLNWVSQVGEFPNLLDHSPIHGFYTFDWDEDQKPDLYQGNIPALRKELEDLSDAKPPEYAENIIAYMLKAIKQAEKEKSEIVLDGSDWE